MEDTLYCPNGVYGGVYHLDAHNPPSLPSIPVIILLLFVLHILSVLLCVLFFVESCLEIHNPYSMSMKWRISTMSPSFVKEVHVCFYSS